MPCPAPFRMDPSHPLPFLQADLQRLDLLLYRLACPIIPIPFSKSFNILFLKFIIPLYRFRGFPIFIFFQHFWPYPLTVCKRPGKIPTASPLSPRSWTIPLRRNGQTLPKSGSSDSVSSNFPHGLHTSHWWIHWGYRNGNDTEKASFYNCPSICYQPVPHIVPHNRVKHLSHLFPELSKTPYPLTGISTTCLSSIQLMAQRLEPPAAFLAIFPILIRILPLHPLL